MKKPRRKYQQTSPEKKKEIALWIVSHPDLTIKQIAGQFDLSYVKVWRIIREYLEVKKVLVFKSTEKPPEQGSDDKLPG